MAPAAIHVARRARLGEEERLASPRLLRGLHINRDIHYMIQIQTDINIDIDMDRGLK